MTAQSKTRKAPKLVKCACDPAKLGPTLRELGAVGSDNDPVSVDAYYDRQGTPCRVVARYQEGWIVRLNRRRDGSYSMSQSISFVVSGKRA